MTSIYRKIFEGLLFLVLQILLFKNSVLNDNFCFIYISFLFFIPPQINKIVFLVIAFCFGFAIDIAYDSLGIHAAVCVLWSYLCVRLLPYIIDYYNIKRIYILPEQNMLNYFLFSTVFIFVHHLIFFVVESNQIDFLTILRRSTLSSLFTFITLLIIYQFFYRRKRSP